MTCAKDGCTKAVAVQKAGLCKTHYNQTRPNRHRKVTMKCDCCGAACVKYDQAQRYSNTFCGQLCRDYYRYGATSSDLPANHWARWYGRTSEWLPTSKQRVFRVGACVECGHSFVESAHQTASFYCSERCSVRMARRRRRAREHSAPGEYTYTQVMRQFLRQGKACAYCKQKPDTLPEPEHVLPLSRGGRNDMSNLVAACRSCNADKCDLTLEEWATSRQRRGLPPIDSQLSGIAYVHLMLDTPRRAAWRDRTREAVEAA